MTLNQVDGNRLLPLITTDKAVLEEMCSPWKESLVVCLLGKKLGFRTMKQKLATTWKPSGDFDILDVDNGFYMVKFDMAEDRDKVINGGPWMIFDHYLAVSTWNREFISPATRVQSTLAWIRIPGLNVVFYDESYLLSVARAIGRPVKVDRNTLHADRGHFARICVELDLTQAVVGKICLEGYWYKVEYEGLQIICGKCGCYGHRSRECTATAPTVVAMMPETQPASTSTASPPVAADTNMETPTRETLVGQDPTAEKPNQESGLEVQMGPTTGTGKEDANQQVAKTVTQLAADFEIVGEWMTVSKRKKKPPTFQGTKILHGIRAPGSSKSAPNHEGRKTKELIINKSSSIAAPAFVVGLEKPTKVTHKENKKRRFPSTDFEKTRGIHEGASSSKSLPGSQTSSMPMPPQVIFGQANNIGDAAENYPRRIGVSVSNGNQSNQT